MVASAPRVGAASDARASAFAYDAFISYRRIEPDASVAARLHARLETFRSPLSTAKLRVCLDREEFVVAVSLPDEIRRRVLSSRFLIVLCTPSAAASEWVAAEVQTFIDAGRKEQILLVLVAGEPRDAFPAALSGDVLAADIRAESKRERWRKLETEKLRLLAPMLGCDFSDLQQREARRRLRWLRKVAMASAVLALSFGVLAAVAVWQRQEAERQRAMAQLRMAQALNVAEKVLWDVDQHLLPVAGSDSARAKIAEVILASLEALDAKDSSASVELEWKRTVARLRLAALLEGSSATARAEAAYREVLGRGERLLKSHPGSPSALQAVVDAWAGLGRLALYQDDYDVAKHCFQRQLEAAQRLTNVDEPPAEDVVRLIDPLKQLAEIQQRAGDGASARETLLRAEEMLRVFLVKRRESPELRHELALVHEDLAYLAFLRRDSSELLRRHSAAKDLLEALLEEQPHASTKIALAKVYEQFGFMARFSEQIDLERSYFNKAWSLIWPAFLSEPQNLGFRERLFVQAGELGDATYRQGDLSGALPMFEHCVLMGLAIHQQDPTLEAPLRRLVAARQVYAEVEALVERAASDGTRDVIVAGVRTLAGWTQAHSPEHLARITALKRRVGMPTETLERAQ